MNEKHSDELSWQFRFILIAISFFAFSWFLKMIGGSPLHVALFITIGFISTGLALISFINGLSVKWAMKKKDQLSSSSYEQDLPA